MIGVSMLVESTVFTSSQRSKRPYGRNDSLKDCSLVTKIVCGIGGGGFGVAVERATLSDSREGVVVWARIGGGMSSSNEYPFALVAWLATGVLSGFGCGVRLIRMKARKIPPTRRKRTSRPAGF
jgi:hypothetical protein